MTQLDEILQGYDHLYKLQEAFIERLIVRVEKIEAQRDKYFRERNELVERIYQLKQEKEKDG